MRFAVFPTVETLAGQAVAAVLVIGSYFGARTSRGSPPEPDAAVPEVLEAEGVQAIERAR